MTALTYENLKDEYKRLWVSMVVRDNWKRAIHTAAERILANKDRYQSVAEKTGVPWYLIGALHHLEANGDFKCHLHNGDPLTSRTRHVPKGRPLKGSPPFSWEESAIDAIRYDQLDKSPSYSIEGLAYLAEKFNGMGYRKYKINSPYLWSGTEQYSIGKFTSDGKFSSGAVSQQIGVMPLIQRLSQLDQTINLHGDNSDTGISV